MSEPPMYEKTMYPAQPQSAYQTAPPPMIYAQRPVQTIIIQNSALRFGEMPQNMQCPQCQATIVTTPVYQTGLLTWIIAGGLCLFGCWLGCCLIPFCVDGCKDVEHHCPNCRRLIGVYRKIS